MGFGGRLADFASVSDLYWVLEAIAKKHFTLESAAPAAPAQPESRGLRGAVERRRREAEGH